MNDLHAMKPSQGAEIDGGDLEALKRKQIVFVTRSLKVGGAENQFVLTCLKMKKKGLPVKIVSFYKGGTLEEKVQGQGIEATVVGKKGRWDVFPFLRKSFSIIKNERPLLIYSYLGAANIVCALFKLLNPGVKVIWSVRASQMDLTLYDPIWRIEKAIMKVLSFVPDKIVANSKAGFWELRRQGYPASKIRVIHNGFDTLRFTPKREEAMDLRRKWSGESAEKRLIGIVARLDPIKDHETFLEAAAILLQRRRDVRFVCVGPDWGGRSRKLQELANTLGLTEHVLWEGERKDMPAVYNALDLLTLCSTSEGFPNVVGEAMACGIPCVVTDVGDCCYLVGDTGRVVPPKNPEALALAWEEMLGQDLREMGKRARERILEHFTVEKMVDETIKVFEEVLGRPLETVSHPPAMVEGSRVS